MRETNTSSGSTAFPNYACPDITVGNANVTDGVVSFEIEMRGTPTAVKNFNLYLRKGNTTVETLTLASALVKEGNVYRVSGEFSATIENPADYYVWISCDYEWYTGYITASDRFISTRFLDGQDRKRGLSRRESPLLSLYALSFSTTTSAFSTTFSTVNPK